MPRRGWTLHKLVLIGGIALLLAGTGVYSQSDPEWYRTYLAGLEKVRVKDYKGAIVLLKKAISENPTSAVSPRYTPYFYAALCYDVSGSKDLAADFYAQEDKHDAIRQFPDDYKILQENFDRIQSGEFGVIVIDRTKPANQQDRPADKPAAAGASSSPPGKQAGASSKPPAASGTPSKSPGASTTVIQKPPKPDPECDLKRCLTPFLRGDYLTALKASDPIIRRNCPDKKGALFIAGASHYSLFLLSGETDGRAKAEADRLFRSCAGYQPPTQWVSPAVLSYYQRVSTQKP